MSHNNIMNKDNLRGYINICKKLSKKDINKFIFDINAIVDVDILSKSWDYNKIDLKKSITLANFFGNNYGTELKQIYQLCHKNKDVEVTEIKQSGGSKYKHKHHGFFSTFKHHSHKVFHNPHMRESFIKSGFSIMSGDYQGAFNHVKDAAMHEYGDKLLNHVAGHISKHTGLSMGDARHGMSIAHDVFINRENPMKFMDMAPKPIRENYHAVQDMYNTAHQYGIEHTNPPYPSPELQSYYPELENPYYHSPIPHQMPHQMSRQMPPSMTNTPPSPYEHYPPPPHKRTHPYEFLQPPYQPQFGGLSKIIKTVKITDLFNK